MRKRAERPEDATAAGAARARQALVGKAAAAPEHERVAAAVRRAQEGLLKLQRDDGHWCFPLEADATITAEYIIYRRLMRLPVDERDRRAAEFLLSTQRADGGWSRYEGAPSHLSLTAEAYFALKIAGLAPDAEPLARARRFVLERGGLARAGVFTRFWLSYFGEYPRAGLPVVPVELVLLPAGFPLSIYEMSSWARGTVVPMAILQAVGFRAPCEEGWRVPELWCAPPEESDLSFPVPSGLFTWERFFTAADGLLRALGRVTRRRPLRARALRVAEQWVRTRQDANGGWGGIQPAMINSTLALCALAGPDDEQVRRGHRAIEDFTVDLPGGLMLQSCVGPVWDTALACKALLDSGLDPADPRLRDAADWLLDRQITDVRGDWAVKRPELAPGGWAFEYENVHYPDVDDTAVICMALDRIASRDPERTRRAVERGRAWTLGMQSRDGGLGAFDADNVREIWNAIPFADMKAMLDRPVEDLTGRLLELLGHFGHGPEHPVAHRALAFVARTQQADGSWWGRWGVNYVYGTWSVVTGLAKIGVGPDDPRVGRALDWLEARQGEDGGFGETPLTYEAPHPRLRGRGPSTPSQTAWALMTLVEGGRGGGEAARRAVAFLLERQREDGTWSEAEWTGTGFPGHFYLRYHGYPVYFPLSALGLWLRDRPSSGGAGEGAA